MALTTVITGSASGIGAATRKRLEDEGHGVIGIDIRNAEVIADLSTQEGRQTAVRAVLEKCEGHLDRLVVSAGLGAHTRPPSLIASVNYFGAVEVVDGLFSALKKGTAPAAVVVCSNSGQMMPMDDLPYVLALLEHDEKEACRIIDEADDPPLAYLGSKNALGKAVRRRSVPWAEAGVRINAVAPGPVMTPLLQGDMDDPLTGEAVRELRVPLGRMGEPHEIAELITFLLGPLASWIHGSIYYIDGGIDAEIRPDRY
jgi:NAD(P)-dependent dehydrogenase (short-subunit alcohol dehydrogenase family)